MSSGAFDRIKVFHLVRTCMAVSATRHRHKRETTLNPNTLVRLCLFLSLIPFSDLIDKLLRYRFRDLGIPYNKVSGMPCGEHPLLGRTMRWGCPRYFL